jgi:hypothetical protein
MNPYIDNILSFSCRHLVNYGASLGFFAPKTIKAELERELKEQTGSSDFASILLKCTPTIQKISNGILADKKQEIDNLLLYAASNAFKQARTPMGGNAFIDLVDHIAKILSKINASPDSVEIVTDELLTVFFPLGAEDLPLTIFPGLSHMARDFVWSKIRMKAVECLRTLHEEFSQVNSNSYKDKFLEIGEKGSALLEEYQKHSKDLSKSIPKMISDGIANYAEKITGEPTEEDRLLDVIKQVVDADLKSLSPIWGFLEKQIEPVILHAVGYLTQFGETEIKTEIVDILNQSMQPGSFELSPENIVENLLNKVGFSEEEKIPMAKTIRKKFYPLLKKLALDQSIEIYKNFKEIVIGNEQRSVLLESFVGKSEAEGIKAAVINFSAAQVELVVPQDALALRGITQVAIESTTLAACTNLFSRIKAVNSSDFVFTTGVSILNVVAKHLKLIHTIKNKEKKIYVHGVTYQAFVSGFDELGYLTQGIPKNKEAFDADQKVHSIQVEIKGLENRLKFGYYPLFSESKEMLKRSLVQKKLDLANQQAILDNERIKEFFIPLTKDLLEILGITQDQIPFPCVDMKESLWIKLTTEIIPKVLCNLYQTLLNPDALHSILLSLLETAELSTETMTAPALDEEDLTNPKETDEINEALKKIINKGIKVVPGTLLELIFSIKKIEQMSAAAIGKSFRKELKRVNIIKIAEEAIVKAFSNTREEEASEKIDSEKTKLKLQTALVDMIIRQGGSAVKKKLLSPWIALDEIIERSIGNIFGEKGLYLKELVDRLCYYIFIDLLGSILLIAINPLQNFVMRRIHCHVKNKVSHAIDAFDMRIHEDLFYKLTRIVVNNLVPPKQSIC